MLCIAYLHHSLQKSLRGPFLNCQTAKYQAWSIYDGYSHIHISLIPVQTKTKEDGRVSSIPSMQKAYECRREQPVWQEPLEAMRQRAAKAGKRPRGAGTENPEPSTDNAKQKGKLSKVDSFHRNPKLQSSEYEFTILIVNISV